MSIFLEKEIIFYAFKFVNFANAVCENGCFLRYRLPAPCLAIKREYTIQLEVQKFCTSNCINLIIFHSFNLTTRQKVSGKKTFSNVTHSANNGAISSSLKKLAYNHYWNSSLNGKKFPSVLWALCELWSSNIANTICLNLFLNSTSSITSRNRRAI